MHFSLEWSQMSPECLHISVLKKAVETFDVMFSITPAVEDHSGEGVNWNNNFLLLILKLQLIV